MTHVVLRQLIIALFEEEGVARERLFKDACCSGKSPERKKKVALTRGDFQIRDVR